MHRCALTSRPCSAWPRAVTGASLLWYGVALLVLAAAGWVQCVEEVHASDSPASAASAALDLRINTSSVATRLTAFVPPSAESPPQYVDFEDKVSGMLASALPSPASSAVTAPPLQPSGAPVSGPTAAAAAAVAVPSSAESPWIRVRAQGPTRPYSMLVDDEGNEYVLTHPADDTLVVEDSRLIFDLVTLLLTSVLLGTVMHFLHQPIAIGFVLGGAVVGPGGLGLVQEIVQTETLCSLGLVFITFALGARVTPRQFVRMQAVLASGAVQLAVLGALGALVARLAGFRATEGLLVASMFAFASSSVTPTALDQVGHSDSAEGWAVQSLLLLHDFVLALIITVLPSLSGAGATWALLREALALAGFVGAAVLAQRRGTRLLLRAAAVATGTELELLWVLIACFALTWLARLMGLPMEVGAFTAGLLLADAGVIVVRRHAGEHVSISALPLHHAPGHGSGLARVLGGLDGSAVAGSTVRVGDHDRAVAGFEGSGAGATGPVMGGGGGGVHASAAASGQPLMAQLQPIRDLFSCLYYAQIGMSIHVSTVVRHAPLVIGMVLVTLLVKTAVAVPLLWPVLPGSRAVLRVALALAHCSELALVVVERATAMALLSERASLLLSAAITMSLVLSPLVYRLPLWRSRPVL